MFFIFMGVGAGSWISIGAINKHRTEALAILKDETQQRWDSEQ